MVAFGHPGGAPASSATPLYRRFDSFCSACFVIFVLHVIAPLFSFFPVTLGACLRPRISTFFLHPRPRQCPDSDFPPPLDSLPQPHCPHAPPTSIPAPTLPAEPCQFAPPADFYGTGGLRLTRLLPFSPRFIVQSGKTSALALPRFRIVVHAIQSLKLTCLVLATAHSSPPMLNFSVILASGLFPLATRCRSRPQLLRLFDPLLRFCNGSKLVFLRCRRFAFPTLTVFFSTLRRF